MKPTSRGSNGDGWKVFSAWNARMPSVGDLALAAFWVAVLSGAALILVFDPARAADSLQVLQSANPAGLFFRALHYWSGQLFLVFTAVHVVEHFARATEGRFRAGVWLRLAASVPLICYLMVSGYILKGDAEGELARQVLTGLLERLPLIGGGLRAFFVGGEGAGWVVYPQHAALATLLVLLIIYEHFRKLWSSAAAWLWTLGVCSLLSLLLPPALQLPDDAVIKGPWYMLGTQEILHWLPRPGWIWVIFGLWLGLLTLLPWLRPAARRRVKGILLGVAVVYLALTAVGAWLRGENWSWGWVGTGEETSAYLSPAGYLLDDPAGSREVPSALDIREGCLVCHSEVKGLAAAHDPEAIGCYSCHLGNPWSGNERVAHRGMEPVPGNLRQAEATCGQADCHAEVVDRVGKTLMADGRGLVGVDRFVFGETDTPNSNTGLTELGDSPADSHLRELCLPCHLAYPKEEPGPVSELSRGGGCTACHLNYHEDEELHPSLDLKIGDEHCFGCHSRSGRISTNYEGWHETLLTEQDERGEGEYRVLEDGRIFVRVADDIHHRAGMACIDCHTAREAMGDGKVHQHQEEQIEVACTDCHLTEGPETLTWDELDEESRKILRLRLETEPIERRFLVAKRSGLAQANVFLGEEGVPILEGKLDGKQRRLLPPVEACILTLPGHERLVCQSCHSEWVPQCLGCHTQRITGGGWEESRGTFLAEVPTLGVRQGSDGEVLEIRPFTPAMIMTLNQEPASKTVGNLETLQSEGSFHRLFAPAAPHTTNRKGRSCESCHSEALALGYGRGELQFDSENRKWTFTAEYGSHRDGLPADAWIPFLSDREGAVATRMDARPFTVEEQHRTLRVGACLTCHPANPGNMERIYRDIDSALEGLDPRCRVPVFD